MNQKIAYALLTITQFIQSEKDFTFFSFILTY